jgi:type II secretory pathway pseudopilin PulG
MVSIKNTAFTIIELLIFITAIALLAAAMMYFIKPQQQAEEVSLISAMNKLITNIESYNNTYGKYPLTSDECSCENPQNCEVFTGLDEKTVKCFNTQTNYFGNILWFSIPHIKDGTKSDDMYSIEDYDVFRYHDYDGGCLTTMSASNRPKLYTWKFGGNLMLCDPGETINPAKEVCGNLYPDPVHCDTVQ